MPSRNDQHTPSRAETRRARPVRRPTRAERGTVLLMVVGVLALLAIIAVVYATLGRSDRAATAAFVRQQRLDDQAELVADYLAQVIGDGLFSTYVERDDFGASFHRRSASDIPWTDEHFISLNIFQPNGTVDPTVLTAANVTGLPTTGPAGSVRVNEPYSPTGASRLAFPDPTGTAIDTREHGASFLASLSPVWLGNVTNNNPNPTNDPLRRRRDWMHISNFAPNGNFVNLAYLRNNFRAESGFGTGTDGRRRLSSQLSLFRPNNGAAYTGGSDVVAHTITGMPRQAHPAIPADWTNNQVWSFRPMLDTQHAPQDPEYLFNQWADTDGDGFADARWFELTDISRAWTGDSQPTSVIPANGRMRLFVAARCIDASGLINLTTATDFARHPGQVPSYTSTNTLATEQFSRDSVYLPGFSPADIDLRRALTMVDWSYEFGQDYGGGMSGFTRPRYNAATPADPRDYTSVTELPAAQIGAAGYLYLTRSLSRTALMINPDYALLGGTPVVLFDRTATANAQGRISREDERVLPTSAPLLLPSRPSAEILNVSTDSTITPLSADLRYLSFLHYGYRQKGMTTQGGSRLFFGGLGMADELELRTFEGLNNPYDTSRLEIAFSGRSLAADSERSPFRDERPLSIELAGRTMTVNQLFGTTNPNDTTATARQVLATLFGDVRSKVTTVSGARPITEGDGGLTVQYDFTPDLMTLRLGAGTNANERREKDAALEHVLDFYLEALLPFRHYNLNYASLWQHPRNLASEGLAYGGRAEIAFRCALHMAVSLADAADEDGTAVTSNTTGSLRDDMQPTAISVEIAPASYSSISSSTFGADDKDLYPWISTSRTQTLTSDHPFKPTANGVRAGAASDVIGSRVVNAFGIEPQPFLIEYGAFFIFTDAPSSVGGASDEDAPQVTTLPDGSSTVVFDQVSISTKAQMDQADFIGEVLFFQLTNPFDDEITLFDAAPTDLQAQPTYYLKFANRSFIFYKQAYDSYNRDSSAPNGGTIRLKPGETKTFYAINPGTQKQLEERIRRVHNARPSVVPDHTPIMTDGFMNDWFKAQFGEDAIQIPMVYPETFEPIGQVVAGGTPSLTAMGEVIDLFGDDAGLLPSGGYAAPTVATKGDRKSATLWRIMRGSRSANTLFSGGGDLDVNSDNDPSNDLLADRLRDPGSAAEGTLFNLHGDSTAGDVDIGSTEAGDENGTTVESTPAQDSDVRDNTGFTYTLWASIRRPTDAQTNAESGYMITDAAGTIRPVRGVLPPWCLEAKSDQAYDVSTGMLNGGGGRWSLNKEFEIDPPEPGDEGDYPAYAASADLDVSTNPTKPDRFRTLAQLVASRTAIIPEIKQSAYLKDGNPVFRSSSLRTDGTGSFVRKRYIEVAPEFHFVGQDDHGGPRTIPTSPSASVTLQRTSRNGMLFSRIGDMLLPMAVGPWSDPVGASFPPISFSGSWNILPTNIDPNNWVGAQGASAPLEYGWTTLGESIALATGYYSPTLRTGSSPGDLATNLYNDFGIDDPAPSSGPVKVSKTDRGCLRLDKFTPYRAVAGTIVEPIGLGIPFALNVISLGRVEPGVGTSLYGRAITGLTRGAAFGGIDKAVPGVGNLNTMSVENYRCHPLISPMPNLPAAFGTDFTPSWATQTLTLTYMGATITTPSPPLLTAFFDQTARPNDVFDLATTLVAYRDKMSLETRPKDPASPGSSRISVNFEDQGPTTQTGRNLATGFTGAVTDPPRLREARGFKSIGEVLAANLRTTDGTNTYDGRNQSMTRLGEPQLDGSTPSLAPLASARIEQPGLVASTYYDRDAKGQVPGYNTPGAILPILPSDVPDSYAAKIAIANALAGTASVRSDVFICWFVVHGYLPEAVEVDDDQPMIPTIAKRFVMVVDRSNVISPGQKPRVLMFKEVPMPN